MPIYFIVLFPEDTMAAVGGVAEWLALFVNERS